MSLNKVILIGNLGRDPELRYMPNGDAVCNFSIATSESWNDRNSGQRQERTEWHNITLYRRLAEVAGQYLRHHRQRNENARLARRQPTARRLSRRCGLRPCAAAKLRAAAATARLRRAASCRAHPTPSARCPRRAGGRYRRRYSVLNTGLLLRQPEKQHGVALAKDSRRCCLACLRFCCAPKAA